MSTTTIPTKLTIALKEEIGDPDLFVGRTQELAFYLNWVAQSKRQMSKSQAILARRKTGKTALVQRLFNILYTQADPQVVPFFFRVKETKLTSAAFGMLFYRTFLTQYHGVHRRDPEMINDVLSLEALKTLAADDSHLTSDIHTMEATARTTPELVWEHARDAPHRIAAKKDIRIIQLIDEFQYLNRFIHDPVHGQVDLCHSYMAAAESKLAPLIVTGSYIGWLNSILGHMTARFEDRVLPALTDEEALATVYNYAALTPVPVTDATAGYIAQVAGNDPFYISQIMRTTMPDLDLTTEDGVRAALQYETTPGNGYIAKIWTEYINYAFESVNQHHAKRMVLYLAKHEDERTRKQIIDDLELPLSDEEVEQRLTKLLMADLISRGSSHFRYRGLGDPVFTTVFRKIYAEEIEQVTPDRVAADFAAELVNVKRRTAWLKGIAGEYKVMFLLQDAGFWRRTLSEIAENVPGDVVLQPFESLKKAHFFHDQETSDEVDIHARSSEGIDLIVEVKHWDGPLPSRLIQEFIDKKARIEPLLDQNTLFLFASFSALNESQKELLRSHSVGWLKDG